MAVVASLSLMDFSGQLASRAGDLPSERSPTLRPGVDPPAAGAPAQIERVAIGAGWRIGEPFDVRWEVAGDESQVAGYRVSLIEVHPDTMVPFGREVACADVPPGSRRCRITPGGIGGDAVAFLAPCVSALVREPGSTPHQRLGPARAVFPPGADARAQLRLARAASDAPSDLPSADSGDVSSGESMPGRGAPDWALGQIESQNAILFDRADPAWNVVAQVGADQEVRIAFDSAPVRGPQRLLAYGGFAGHPEIESEADVRVYVLAGAVGDDGPECGPWRMVQRQSFRLSSARGAPSPMTRIDQRVDPRAGSGFGPWAPQIALVVQGRAIDPRHPPILLGVRLVPAESQPVAAMDVDAGKDLDAPPEMIRPEHFQLAGPPPAMATLTLPFGQEHATTPWPMINMSRGPVNLPEPNFKGTLSWDAKGIQGCAQVEFEVKYGSAFTVLGADEPGRIDGGVLKQPAGQHPLDFAKYGKGLGTYYVRVAAQDAKGADVAFRSQPVVVNAHPAGAPPGDAVLLSLTFAGFTDYHSDSALTWNVTSDPDSIMLAGDFSKNPMAAHGMVVINATACFTATKGWKYFHWRTPWPHCAKGRFEVAKGDFGSAAPIHDVQDTGHPYQSSGPKDVHGHIKRFGYVDLLPVYQKILAANPSPGQPYAVRVTPLDAAGSPCGGPSDTQYLQFAPYAFAAKAKIKTVYYDGGSLDLGTPVGGPCPPPVHEGTTVMPAFTCWKDNTKLFISFEGPMDAASVNQAIGFSPPWPDIVTKWYQDNQFGVGHMSSLWFDTVYTITLGTGAKTKSGAKILDKPLQWRVKTLPFAEKIPGIKKLEIAPNPVVIPPGDVTLSYRVEDATDFYMELVNVYGEHGSGTATYDPPLPEGSVRTRILNPVPNPKGPSYYIRAVAGNALGFFAEHFPFQIKQIPKAKADLAIDGAMSSLVPGPVTGAPIFIAPQVTIKNLGPEPMPNELLALTKVITSYYIDPPVGTPGYGTKGPHNREVACTNTLAQTKNPPGGMGPWFIVPTCPELPYGVFTKLTRLYGAKTEVRLPMSETVSQPGLGGAILPHVLDGNMNNNSHAYFPDPWPVVLNAGAGQ